MRTQLRGRQKERRFVREREGVFGRVEQKSQGKRDFEEETVMG